jgi:hypothetical protein
MVPLPVGLTVGVFVGDGGVPVGESVTVDVLVGDWTGVPVRV